MPYIITIEAFIEEYEEFVREWFRFRNQQNFVQFKQGHIEEEDFWSELLRKIVENEILNKYDQKPHSGANFETWLKMVLNNLFIDMASSIVKRTWISIDSTDNEDTNGNTVIEDRFIVHPEERNSPDIEIKIVKQMIDQIPKMRNRILVKLKTYIDGFTEIDDEEIAYLETMNDIEDIAQFISDNIYDDKAGMRDKDIAKLLDMKLGTVNTTYRRIVSKHIIDPYKIYKVNNE